MNENASPDNHSKERHGTMESPKGPQEITQLLQAAGDGDHLAREELFRRVYEELRRMARRRMQLQSPGATLQTTELVHEVYLKLCGGDRMRLQNRRHFFGAAVRAMRQILVDRARERLAEKRGGDQIRVTLDHRFASDERPGDLLALDQALDRLAQKHPRPATIVTHRYFLGLSIREIAELLDISQRTVNTDWSFAKAWLKRDLSLTELPIDS